MHAWLFWISAFLVGAVPAVPPAQSAPITLKADWGNLNGAWRFRTDPEETGETEGRQKPGFPETGWRTIDVPGSWEAQGVTDSRPGQPPKPKNGVPWTDYDGVAWYRLHFVVPQAWAGQEFVLALGSVDDQDRTFLNGSLVGATGTGSESTVTLQRQYRIPASLVKYGTENVLAIRVVDGGGPGGLMGPMLTLLPVKVWNTAGKIPQSNRTLKERFAEPAAETRILKMQHSWPDGAEAQQQLVRQLVAQGFGGAVCNVSFNDYLTSEHNWGELARALKTAKSAGMALWLYDEKGYPSGTAGGLTLKDHPEFQARGLLIGDAVSNGGEVSLDVPPGTLMAAAAYPIEKGQIVPGSAVDLTAKVRARKLTASLPQGRWRVMAITEDRLYEGTHAELSLGDKIPYVNLLEPAPTARFLEVTHRQYADRLGSDLSRCFAATFTDEPSLMSLFLRPMPWRILPWGPSLSGEFRKRRGYALEPLLPMLVADAGPNGEKARYDYWQTVGEMVSENYFGQIRAWCRAHGISSGGHLLYEEPVLYHVPLYGNFFQCARTMDAPGIDCLTSVPAEVPWFIARLVSSAAELEGRTLRMCETSDFGQVYRPAGDTRPARPVSEEEIRGACNRLLLNGINTINSYYTFNGISTEQLQRINRWVGRCSTLLRGGHQVADVAVLYPIESIWPRYTPTRHLATDSPAAAAIDSAYRTAYESLYAASRDFTFIDSRTVAEGKVDKGALAYGNLRWRVLILPCVDTLPMKAWENLARFVRTGGIAIALSALPANSETEFPSPRVLQIGAEIFGSDTGPHVTANAAGGAGILLPVGSESLLSAALDAMLPKDARISQPHSPIHVTHRRIDGREVFFLINDSGGSWKGTVSLCAAGEGERWDPATGKISSAASGAPLPLDLPAYGGVFFRFAKEEPPSRLPVKNGPLPGLVFRALPAVVPTVGGGEFVRSSLTNTGGLWQVVGTLTKGKTDTFLFASHRFSQPLDLRSTDGLCIDTQVPDGQSAMTNLLVILTEKGGAQYVANTGRALSWTGANRTIVPWSRFDPAGWSKDADGKLDLDRIEAISIGWGGYFGTEGERVEFTLSGIRTFMLPR